MASKLQAAVGVVALAACVGALVLWDQPWPTKAAILAVLLVAFYWLYEWRRTLERIHRIEQRLGLDAVEDDAEWQKAKQSLGYDD